MEIPDIVRSIAAFMDPFDALCLAVTSHNCYASLHEQVVVKYRGDDLFGMAVKRENIRQAYWWLDYGVYWDEGDAQDLLQYIGRQGLHKSPWPGRLLDIFSEKFHSMDESVLSGLVERHSGGDDTALLADAADFYLKLEGRRVDWADIREDHYFRGKLQWMIDIAADISIPLHHNLCQTFGVDFPETDLV